MFDALGDRMKSQYEDRYRVLLPRRTYTLVRLDGRNFHGYTKHLERPFDEKLACDLNQTALYLCENIQGAVLSFIQSDEISVLLTDFATEQTQAFFDGNMQKLVSISASMTTARFNDLRLTTFVSNLDAEYRVHLDEVDWAPFRWAQFDSRAFVIPDPTEVYNYFVWRQKDATRNSISSTAQHYFNHYFLQGKSTDEMQDLLMSEYNVNWNDMNPGFKRGRIVHKVNGEWIVEAPPIFTQNPEFLQDLIPRYS